MSLPVLQPDTQRIRRSRTTRWRAAVLLLVHLAIAAHITHWLVAGRTITPVEPSEAAALARSGIVNAGLIFFAVTIVLTAVFGRFFCGWACHLVALQDLSRSLFDRFGHRPKPLRSRLLRWVPTVAFLYAFVLPAVLRWRGGASVGPLQSEITTTDFWATFPGWIVGALTFLVCGVLAIYFLGAKGFCTFACPYGAAFAAADRLSPFRIRVTDACEHCGHCTATCTSNVRIHEEVRDWGMVVDSGCMKCMDCVSVCPNDALYYGAGPVPLLAKRRDSGRKMTKFPLSWWEEGVLAVAFVLGFLTFRGLYGAVPLLMALGVAAVLAYLVLLAIQLGTRENLRLKSWQLKKAGRILPAGRGFVAGMALLGVFWVHSGAVRWFIARGDRATPVAARWQPAIFDLSVQPPQLPPPHRKVLESGAAAFGTVERIGIFPTLGLASNQAVFRYLLGDLESAEDQALRSIERGERVARMHQVAARVRFDRRDLGGTVEHLEAAIDAEPRDEQPRANLGIALAHQGKLDEARTVFEEAIGRFGERTALLYDRALVDAWSGRLEAAAAGFARTLEVDPSHLPARENLAGMLAVLGRYDEALDQYEEAIDRSPEDPVTRVLYAQVLATVGNLSAARDQVAAALELAPDLEEARALQRALEAAPAPSSGDLGETPG